LGYPDTSSSSNKWGFVVLGKQKLVLSSGAGRDIEGQATANQAAANQTAHPGAKSLGVATAASLGLCIIGGMAAPADARHYHHPDSSKSEARKQEAPKQPTGPLLLAVSIGSQKVTVFDNGTPIATSQISTGMSGHPTPMGIFSVIQKQRYHHSNIYSGAPMPFMQRITWSGIALHAGVVPGYPASHGCIRLPERFAVRLYGMTRMGVRVIITRGEASPYELDHPRLASLTAKPPVPEAAPNPDPPKPDGANPDGAKPDAAKPDGKPEGAAMAPGAVVVATTGAVSAGESADASDHEHGAPAPTQTAEGTEPGKGPATEPGKDPAAAAAPKPPLKGDDVLQRPGHLALFVSRKEGKLYVRKNFTPAFDVPITIAQPERPLGTHLFTANRAADGSGVRWMGVSFGYDRAAAGSSRKHRGRGEKERSVAAAPLAGESLRQSAIDALDRIGLPAEAVARIAPLVAPGTSLVISDQGLGGETGQETDFIVVTK
jgi:lipoprotein-anchoring transpeptidase ErfK/SrfK